MSSANIAPLLSSLLLLPCQVLSPGDWFVCVQILANVSCVALTDRFFDDVERKSASLNLHVCMFYMYNVNACVGFVIINHVAIVPSYVDVAIRNIKLYAYVAGLCMLFAMFYLKHTSTCLLIGNDALAQYALLPRYLYLSDMLPCKFISYTDEPN